MHCGMRSAQTVTAFLKMLAVTGNDLIKAGMKPGKEVGQTLHHFLELVLEEPEKNSREYLLGMLKV